MNCSRQLDYFFKENSDLPSEVDSVWVAFNSMLINGLNWDPYILVIGSAGKEFTCNAGDLGSIPGLGRSPGAGKGYPTPVFWPGDFHGLYSYICI